MGVLWHKIIRDIWHNRGRTLQVVLIIAIGAASIGMILGTRNLMIPGMAYIWTKGSPAMINLFVGPPVTEDELQVLRRVEGVQQIEGFTNATIEWRLTPEDEWRQGGLTARVDYANQIMNKLDLIAGQLPEDKLMAVEDGSDTYFGIPRDGAVYLRINNKETRVEIKGVVYNPLSQPAYLGGTAQFYTTLDYYEYLVGDADFSRLLVSAPAWDEAAVTDLADRLQKRLEDQGKASGRMITDPNKHFFQDQIDGLFFMLGVMAALALGLGLLLVYNTINALIMRQVDQIGIMKAVGATTGMVLRFFLTNILVYGLLAMLIAVPLGILGAAQITTWLVGSFGATFEGSIIDPMSVVLMVVITLVAPLAAALLPVLSGARITVREAISTYGLSSKMGLIERVGARLRFLSRLVLLTISNTFRSKRRVILTQVVLVLSGLIFMMVVSTRDSIIYTVNDVIFEILGADVTLVFEKSYRADYLERVALQHPQVRAVEAWALAGFKIRPAGQPESEDDKSTTVFGVPLPTELYGYQLREGRWLEPGDQYALVLNQSLAEDIGVTVGDWVTIQYGEKQARDWEVVGLVFDPIILTSSSVPRDILLRDLNQVGRVGTLWIDTNASRDLALQIAVAKTLREYFKQNHFEVSAQRGVFGIGGDSTAETAATLINQFNFIIILLGLMALIIGGVGSIALSGTISLSVMERTREIGVMRAIGASSFTIARLFIGEGLILGWLSWLIALPLSLPAGRIMVVALGQAFQNEYVYHYSPTGAILWLVIITILSILASWLPARSATRVSVRESLAYQ